MTKKVTQLVDQSTGEITQPLVVKTQYNAKQFPRYIESNTLPSETVPNQSMSLRTLLDRYSRGLPITGNNAEPEYYGDEDMPDLRKMDISEIHALKQKVKSDIQTHETTLRDHKAKSDKDAADKKFNDEVDKRVKDKLSKPDDEKPKS